MKSLRIALLLAMIGFSAQGFANEAHQKLVGKYSVKENIECLNGDRPDRAPSCAIEASAPEAMRGEIVISQPSGSKFLRLTETLPYSRLTADIRDADTTDSLGSRWIQRINRMDENGFHYTQESLQKFADFSIYSREDFEVKLEDGKWYYLHTVQGETSQIPHKYFRKFLLEKQ